ncbi:Pre-rRNA-processing protein ipi3 [Malassezia sp. CBS 17886]|nr:Pre-rRNA-processing protein ipi3 [Malassezia sp. CBS 17886]
MSSARSLAALFPGEVVVCASSSSAQRGTLYVVDPAAPSNAPLLHWKGALHTPPNGADAVPSAYAAAADAGLSGVAVALDDEKAVLSVYSWKKDQPMARLVLPQKMSCVALSPEGTFLACGSPDGRLFVWDMRSGALLASLEAHYRAVSAVRWTSDSAAVVTGSADARICVWSLPGILHYTDLAGAASTTASIAPYASFSDHTLPVTDVRIAPGAFPEAARVWSASADGYVKLWDLRVRRLVSTFTFPEPVTSIAVDPLERFFFASAARAEGAPGCVFRVDMYAQDGAAWRMRGGRGGEGAVERVGDDRVALSDAVSALALSQTGSHLLVGTSRAQVHVVDVGTLQTVRVFSAAAVPAPKTPVTVLQTLRRPADLAGALQLRAATSGTKRGAALQDADAAASVYLDALPMPPVPTQLARALAPPHAAREALLRLGDCGNAVDAMGAYLGWRDAGAGDVQVRDAGDGLGVGAAAAAAQGASPSPAQSAEVAQLRAQLARAKELNDSMWQQLARSKAG